VTDVSQQIQCKWCRAQSPMSATSCDRCGAPLDIRDAVSDAGWRQAPRIPIRVPNTNASTVVTPTRPSVHGIALLITWLTGSPVTVSEMPKLPVAMSPR